jgi:hypothetical protein
MAAHQRTLAPPCCAPWPQTPPTRLRSWLPVRWARGLALLEQLGELRSAQRSQSRDYAHFATPAVKPNRLP